MIGVGAAGPRGRAAEAPRRAGNTPSRAAAVEPTVLPFDIPGAGWRGIDLSALDVEDERPYWIALSLIPGVGQVGFARLLRRFGTARRAWESGDRLLAALSRLPEDAMTAYTRLRRTGPARASRHVITATEGIGGRVVTAMEAGYPPALAPLDPRPPVLYVAGDHAALESPAVAIVGTRRPTSYGRAMAIELADELARAGVTVVSGLAIGIDGEAHAAALSAGGRSIGVLPSPLDRVYPPRHRPLATRMLAGGGALVSELAPGHAPGRPDFARRNRIIAGLASAVVVVEAPDRSGALLTAAAAGAIGREVYAVPGPIDSVASRGCNRLIADHSARLVTSSLALLHEIGIRGADTQPSVASLSDVEGLVLGILLRRPGSIEEVAAQARLSPGALASALTMLEARGLVTSYGGATFHPTLGARRTGRST